MRRALALSLVLGCGSPAQQDAPATAATTPSAAVDLAVDLKGAPVDPFAGEHDVVVLVFTGRDCPISNRYAPEIGRVRAAFDARKVGWWLVYVDPDDTAADIEKHLAEFQLAGPALHDRAHALVKRAGVRVTPEAAVFVRGPDGPTRVYRGRIDDRYLDYGRARGEAQQRDLHDAIAAALEGRAPKLAETEAVGCPIDDLLPPA